jgi:aryl-alcohol dehydrogenase
MTRTQAAVLSEAHGPFTIEDVDLDEPRDREVLIRIAGVGMCHTDMVPRLLPPGSFALPMIFGHEGSGTVEAVGPGVETVKPGDAVALSFDSCGTCVRCRSGEPAYCIDFPLLNSTGARADGTPAAHFADGRPLNARWFGQSSFAAHAIATERNVVKLPDSELPLHLAGPLGCGIQTGAASILVEMNVRVGESVAVFGTGAVGLSAIMAATVAGAGTVIGVDLHQKRRDLALEFGATHVFDGADPDLATQLRQLTGGGVKYALETTGVPSVVATAIECLQPRGFCGLVGVGTEPLSLSPQALGHGRAVSFLLEGNAVPQLFIPKLVELWSRGRFPFDRLIETYPLAAANDAEADSLAGRTVKPVLLPGLP